MAAHGAAVRSGQRVLRRFGHLLANMSNPGKLACGPRPRAAPRRGQHRQYDFVLMGALGPLIADDSARLARAWRRVRGITVEVVALVLVTVLAPVLVAGGLAVDVTLWLRRRKPWMAVRLV